ncbi:hypothetical protein MJO29_008091 [Puccinia striiformis f. sp. tritici]|nr:hypothetical protein MJO29_008091 [Puccinia striiformis f. sp. tritici]
MADSQVLNMPTKWVYLIDESADDDFEGFFSLMEQFTGRKMVPVPTHMLQLIGLVVHPMFCLRSQIPASNPDPIVLTGKKVAGRAWSCLGSFIKTSGPQAFLRCIPGYHNSELVGIDVIWKDYFKNQDLQPVVRRLVDRTTIWEILMTLDESAKQTISPGGWDLLDLLIMAWEIDFKHHGVPKTQTEALHQSNNKPLAQDRKTCFPHFLRQLTDAPAGGFRVDGRVYDIIFEPFSQNSASPDYSWGFAINSRDRAQRLSMRLLHLVDQLDGIQFLEPGRLREDIVIRMLGLETPDLLIFVHVLPADHLLRTRLLSRYLESVTRPIPTPLAGFMLSNSQSSTTSLSPGRSATSTIGLRWTPSRTALKPDDRPMEPSISNSKPQFITLSSLITQLLPRPLLDIPATATQQGLAGPNPTVLINAESRYLSVLNVILGSLLVVHESKTSDVDVEGLNLVKHGKLRSAIQAFFDSITEACGSKLDSLKDKKTLRALLHCRLNRSIKAFENLASKP